MSGRPRQQTLFQSWGKQAQQSGTDLKFNHASTSTSGAGVIDSEVIDLVDDMEDDELLAAAMDGYVETSDPSSDVPTSSDCTTLEDLPGFDISAGKLWIYPTNYPVREYQYNIVHQALFKNTLVTLPTGLGKTFIAAVVMYNFYRWYPMGKVIFMAPTKPLVAQQIEACFNIMGIPQNDTAEMTGSMPPSERKRAWQEKRVFFLTPQVMVNDLSRGACPAEDVKCLVVDEAHKALGNHAFCQVVQELVKFTLQFRVLALSATPGGDLKGVQQVLSNLLITHVELRSEDSADIQPYTHERKVEKIVVPLGDQLKQLQDRYLAVVGVFVARLVRNKAMFCRDPAKVTKFQLLKSRDLFRANPPPEAQNRVLQGCVEGDFATCISLYHSYELLLQHGMKSFYSFLANIMEDEKGSKKKRELAQNPDFMLMMGELKEMFNPSDGSASVGGYAHGHGVCTSPKTFTQRKGPSSQKPVVVSHPKLAKLEEVVQQHFQQFDNEAAGSSTQAATKPAATRVMIFAQYRDSVQEIADILNHHRPLVRVMTFIGQASTGKVKKGFTQKEQLAVMKKFREGGYNVLVSTCVGEEGLDIGDVDLIVCFDAHKSPIRLVQRMGRTGRKRQGRIVMLVTEGKEERIYNQSQYSKKSIHKALQGSTKSLNFYMNNPRMVPRGVNPAVHKMHITVGSYHCTAKGKDRRGSVKGSKAITSFTKAQPKGKVEKDDGFLTAQELAVWNERYKLSVEEEKAIPILQPARFVHLKDTETRDQPRRPSLSLTEWSIWQNRLQPTHLIGHSKRCKNFVELMEFIDLQKDAEDEDSYGMEMKAFLNKDDIITTSGTSRSDIRTFITEPKPTTERQGDVEKNYSVGKRRSKTFEGNETRPIDSDDDLPVITLNPNTVSSPNVDTGDRNGKGSKVGRAKDKKKSPRGPNSLPKQKRKPLVIELDHDSDFESQEGKENTSAKGSSIVDRSLQREAEVVQENRDETVEATCKSMRDDDIENEGCMPFDGDIRAIQEDAMTVTDATDMEEDEEDKWEAIFPTFLHKNKSNIAMPVKESTRQNGRYRVPTPPSLDSFEWLERLEEEMGSSIEDSQDNSLKQPFPCKKSLIFEAVSNCVSDENNPTYIVHKTENSDLQEERKKEQDNSFSQSKQILELHSIEGSRHIENENTIRPGYISTSKQNREGSHGTKTNDSLVLPSKMQEETKTVDETDIEGSDSDSLFGNGSDDMFAEMEIEEETAECPEEEEQQTRTVDDQVQDTNTAVEEGNQDISNHSVSPVFDTHHPLPSNCSPPSLFSDYEESFHTKVSSKPTKNQDHNSDKPPTVPMVCAKTLPSLPKVVADDSLLGVDVDVGITHTDGEQIPLEEEGPIAVNFDLGGDSLLEPQFDLQFSDEDMFADSSPSGQVTETNRDLIGFENETLSEGFPLPIKTNSGPKHDEEEDAFNSIPNTPPFQRYQQAAKTATYNHQANDTFPANNDDEADGVGHEELFSECDIVASTPVHGPGRTSTRVSLRSKRNATPDNLCTDDSSSPKEPTIPKRHNSESLKGIKRNTVVPAPSRGSNKINLETCNDGPTSVSKSKPGASAATWSCSTCTFLNHALLSACEMCDSPKLGSNSLDPPKATVVSSDSDEDDVVVKRKRSRAQVLKSPETSTAERKGPVSSDSDEDAAVVKRKRSRAQVLKSPETSTVERKAPVSSDSDEDVLKRKRSRAQMLRSPDLSAVKDPTDTFLAKGIGKGLRNKVLNTTAEDSDSDFDLPAQSVHKYNQQVSRQESRQKKDVGRRKANLKSHRSRHAARGFLDEEAELSDEEAEFVSSDEDEEGNDSFLEGFVSYSSQCTQATSEEEMRAVYLQSVRSPALHAGRGYKLVKKPWDPDVFSQVPAPDIDDYEQDSFCVGDDEDISAAECTMVEPVRECTSPDLGGVRTRRQKRAAVLEDTPERKQQGQPKGKRKRIVMADTSSEEDSPGPTNHQAKILTTPPRSDNKSEEQPFKTPVGRPPARRSLIGQASGRRNMSLGIFNEIEDHDDDDFDTSRYNRKLCNEDPVDRCQTNSLSRRNTTSVQGEIVSTQRLEMSLAERLRLKQTMVGKSSNFDGKQNTSASAIASVPVDRRKSFAAKPPQRFEESLTKQVESVKGVEPTSTITDGISTRRPEPSPKMMNTTITTPRSALSRKLEKLVVLVDSREIASSQQVVSSLRFHHDINAVVCQLGSCDYILSNRMGVERKTLSDFGNSTNREKLVQRVQELCELFDKPCLIVEKDRVKPGMEPKKARTPTKYHSTVLAALAHTSVTVLFTDTQEQTASLLADLAKLEQRKGNSVNGSPEVEAEGEQVFRMYLSMPGVHYATALNLYYNCGGLSELMKCTAMQLQMKGKMSLQKASSLHQFLRHNFNPQMLVDK